MFVVPIGNPEVPFPCEPDKLTDEQLSEVMGSFHEAVPVQSGPDCTVILAGQVILGACSSFRLIIWSQDADKLD